MSNKQTAALPKLPLLGLEPDSDRRVSARSVPPASGPGLVLLAEPDAPDRKPVHVAARPASLIDPSLLEQELEVASRIQQLSLPEFASKHSGLQVAGFCQSARQIGGDFYDVVSLDGGGVLLVVADVMGKGIPGALFAATLRSLLRGMVQWTQSPGDLLARVNRLLYGELSKAEMFITAQLAVADPATNVFKVSSAGHCPLLVRNGAGEVQAVAPEGVPLGIMPEALFVETVVPFEAGSCGVLYTDGVVEARNASSEPFGEQRLRAWLGQSAHSAFVNSTDFGERAGSAAELRQALVDYLGQFQGGARNSDDQTFLLVLYGQEASLVPAAGVLPTTPSLDEGTLSVLAGAPAQANQPSIVLIPPLELTRANPENCAQPNPGYSAEPPLSANPQVA